MTLVKKGDLLTLLGWQRLFPMARSATELKLAIAWGMALAIRLKETLELLQQIESDLGDQHSPENAAIACECATIRSVAIALGDDSQEALSLAEDCLGRSNDPWTTNVASNVVRLGYLKAGDLAQILCDTVDSLLVGRGQAERLCIGLSTLSPGIGRGSTAPLVRSGTLLPRRSCIGGTTRGTELGRRRPPAQPPRAIRYEQGRIDEAEGMVFDRLPILSATAMLDCVLSAYFVLVRLAATSV